MGRRRQRIIAWLGDLQGLLRCFWNYAVRKRTQVTSAPLEVSLEVTNVCNYRCAFCPQSDRAHLETVGRHYLTPEKAGIILDGFRRLGYTRSMLHWTLDGEPFMNKRFAELSALAADHGYQNQYFASNLHLLTVERARTLSRSVRYEFNVDFCADKTYFEEVRGTRGAWETVRVNITGILADRELEHLSFVVADISSFGIDDPKALRENMRRLRAVFPRSDRIRFAEKTFHNATGTVDLQRSGGRSRRYHLCPYPWTSLSIAASGDVVPCCRELTHKTVLGNALETPLAEIWNGEPFIRFRENLVRQRPELNAACRDCDMPWDGSKFSAGNLLRTLRNRLQVGK